MLHLHAGDYVLYLTPEEGGAVARFDWRGEPLFRRKNGAGIFRTGSFPLVPFSNRIADGRAEFHGKPIQMRPNFPAQDSRSQLHGFGCMGAWRVVSQTATSAKLAFTYKAGEWPWAFEAEQTFRLSPDGHDYEIAIRNLSDDRMPAGLGIHPYFPRTDRTRFISLHKGEWTMDADKLPVSPHREPEPIDWWRGQPVGTRRVDTIYTERQGPLEIVWPERNLALLMAPSENLPFTVVYTEEPDSFCAEPVSHMNNALNLPDSAGAMKVLAPGERFAAQIRFAARAI